MKKSHLEGPKKKAKADDDFDDDGEWEDYNDEEWDNDGDYEDEWDDDVDVNSDYDPYDYEY